MLSQCCGKREWRGLGGAMGVWVGQGVGAEKERWVGGVAPSCRVAWRCRGHDKGVVGGSDGTENPGAPGVRGGWVAMEGQAAASRTT